MTVNEIIEEILSIKDIDTPSNLKKKRKKELFQILEDLRESKTVETEPESSGVDVETESQESLDLEAIKKQMLEELKEQARKEVEAEMKKVSQEAPEDPEKEDVKPVPKRGRRLPTIDRFEQIPVMNVTFGNLIYRSRKTGMETKWAEYGDIEYLEFQELITMKSGSRKFFEEPFILILDDEVVQYFGMEEEYKAIDEDMITNCLKLPFEEFKTFITDVPRGVQATVVQMVRNKVKKGEFDSLRVIKFLEDKFQIEIREE